MRISDWSSDVCSSDLKKKSQARQQQGAPGALQQILELLGIHAGPALQRGTQLAPAYENKLADQPEHGTNQCRKRQVDHPQHNENLEVAEGIGLDGIRSEEHTSEIQSLMRISYAVFCLKK